ncbi:MAG: hypothetical protein HYW91_03115 [Candidatus Sungbacteria bacterium]|nr:hypothetical protein [Candidatus Sungbacteria bacterium]
MKSDIEEMFKSSRPSFIKIVSRETERGPIRQEKIDFRKYYYAAAGLIAIVLAGITGYWLLSQEEVLETPAKLIPPAPFFATETSRTISIKMQDRAQFIRLMEDSLQEFEREGTMKRILIKVQDGPQERFATLADFLTLWRITPPPNLLLQTEPPFMVFIYYGRSGSRIGLATRARDLDRVLGEMLLWEPSLLRDFQQLFFGERPETILSLFEDRTYRNIDWRYLKLSPDKDFGLGHTLFPARSLLVIATGKDALETAINRLFEAK